VLYGRRLALAAALQGLVTTRQYPAARSGAHDHPLKPTGCQPAVPGRWQSLKLVGCLRSG
jgi:hypothetical protein